MRSIRQNIRTEVLTYKPIEMRSIQKTKVRIFSVWNEQLVNPKQAGLFADWYGGGADFAPLCNFCLNGPIDLKFGIVDSTW